MIVAVFQRVCLQSGRRQRASVIRLARICCCQRDLLLVYRQCAGRRRHQVVAYLGLHAGLHRGPVHCRDHVVRASGVCDRALSCHRDFEFMIVAVFQRVCLQSGRRQRASVIRLARVCCCQCDLLRRNYQFSGHIGDNVVIQLCLAVHSDCVFTDILTCFTAECQAQCFTNRCFGIRSCQRTNRCCQFRILCRIIVVNLGLVVCGHGQVLFVVYLDNILFGFVTDHNASGIIDLCISVNLLRRHFQSLADCFDSRGIRRKLDLRTVQIVLNRIDPICCSMQYAKIITVINLGVSRQRELIAFLQVFTSLDLTAVLHDDPFIFGREVICCIVVNRFLGNVADVAVSNSVYRNPGAAEVVRHRDRRRAISHSGIEVCVSVVLRRRSHIGKRLAGQAVPWTVTQIFTQRQHVVQRFFAACSVMQPDGKVAMEALLVCRFLVRFGSVCR